MDDAASLWTTLEDTNMKLTDTALRALKPSDKVQKLSDGGGLYLHVTPTGSKLWRMAYRFAGKQKTLALGVYPTVSLAQARRKRDEARELLAQMGLSERADHYPHQLSGGQQQRVAIARALALHPDILCFDEPTSALDPELTGEVLRVLRELAEHKTTMIIVTHEMKFARDAADRILFMDGGVVVEQGDARELIDHPKEERTRQFLASYGK